MTRWMMLAKFVAIACSAALLVAYVCWRTGGHVVSDSEAGQSTSHRPDVPVMGGSKSAPILNPH